MNNQDIAGPICNICTPSLVCEACLAKIKKRNIAEKYKKDSEKTDSAIPCPICGGYYPGDCKGGCCMSPFAKCDGCNTWDHMQTDEYREEMDELENRRMFG